MIIFFFYKLIKLINIISRVQLGKNLEKTWLKFGLNFAEL